MNRQTSLTKAQAIQISRQFIAKGLRNEQWYLHAQAYVKAIVLYGSTAKGLNRPDSDIDLLIFLPLAVEQQYTSGEYFYNFAGHEINIVIRSIERLREIAQKQEDLLQKEVFRGSVIIESSDNEIAELLATIAKIQ
ncbi:MAG TPA: nucleotidyltransferase domain-containing protein [Candidatus Saccharimonadales bacterium]